MITQFLLDLGPWSWLILGLLLLVGEAVVPGVFLVWFGAAGIVVGLLTVGPFAEASFWPWQMIKHLGSMILFRDMWVLKPS